MKHTLNWEPMEDKPRKYVAAGVRRVYEIVQEEEQAWRVYIVTGYTRFKAEKPCYDLLEGQNICQRDHHRIHEEIDHAVAVAQEEFKDHLP